MNEPQKKDGIWIKTNHTYQNVMINQQFANYQDGVWSAICPLNNMGRIKLVINQGALYLFSNKDYKLYRLNGSALEYICDYNSRTNVITSYNNSLYIITASTSTGYVFKYNGSNLERVSEFYGTIYFDMNCVTLYNDQICLFYSNTTPETNYIYIYLMDLHLCNYVMRLFMIVIIAQCKYKTLLLIMVNYICLVIDRYLQQMVYFTLF